MVDAKTGIIPLDLKLAKHVHTLTKKVILVGTKRMICATRQELWTKLRTRLDLVNRAIVLRRRDAVLEIFWIMSTIC